MKWVLPLRTWLLGSYLVVFLLPAVALVGTGALAKDLNAQTREDLTHQATLLSLLARDNFDTPERLGAIIREAKESTLAGYRIVDAHGIIIASSGDDVGQSTADQVEVQGALEGAVSAEIRPRDNGRSLSQPLSSASRRASVRVFVAAPVTNTAGEVIGAVAVSRTPREELQAFYQMAPRLGTGLIVAIVLTIVVAFSAGHYATRSLISLRGAFDRIASGVIPAPAEYADAADSRIAETRALSRALQTMSDRLRDRLAYISEFAGNVSHEFKTPVSSLRGTIELLRDDEEMPPAQRSKFLDNALSDLDRMSRLVGGLLRLARAEEGGGREPFDLGALAQNVAARHGVDVSTTPLLIVGNPEQLDAVVTNLVENARRYGGPSVNVSLRADGGSAELTVMDDGAGISESNLPRVFDRFFTTDRARGGTGLGLALVRTIVEAHGGQVSVSSRPGETRFVVTLPMLPPERRGD